MKRNGVKEMGRVTVEVQLANYRDSVLADEGQTQPKHIRRATISGIVDTGASHLVVPKKVAAKLGVSEIGTARVRLADQRSATRKVVQDVELTLLGRTGVFKAIVEPNRDDALIGAIVLEDLDFVVDCRTGKLHPRDPDRIVSEIE